MTMASQETEWVKINFERKDLYSPHKSHPPRMIFGKFAFSFAFDLSKQNKTDFSFISLILFRIGFFGAAHGSGGGGQKSPLPS